MEKLTNKQIDSIIAALKQTGIVYVDILHEMTDHVAALLENTDGDFERNLRRYIYTHKKELRRFNSKAIFFSWKQSYKALFLNILTVRFAVFFGLAYLSLTGLNVLMGRDLFVTVMFFVFCMANAAVSSPEIYRMIKKRAQYSAGEGLGVLNVFVFFPGLYSFQLLDEISSGTLITIYFTVLISVCAVMFVTLRRLKTNYKLQYND
jgi:hypothetical protein